MDLTAKADADCVRQFLVFVQDPLFPCLGAKAALSRQSLEIMLARDIQSGWNDLEIHARLVEFVADYRKDLRPFRSFAVLFQHPSELTEPEFEQALWDRIQSFADKDEWKGLMPDPQVSDNPVDPHFSLSIGGEGFFVVGLHPLASRPARRFVRPAMVFNLHHQFETLRSDGRYEKLRERILARDVALAGSENPMLQAFGEGSEARQYSGRAVGPDWTCPYQGRRRSP